MSYDCSCDVIGNFNYLRTYVKIGFFFLPLSIMKCSVVPLTHIYEWKMCSPFSNASSSSRWIFVVAMVILGSTSMICFPFSVTGKLGSTLYSKSESHSKYFTSATNDCFKKHSLVLYEGCLCNLHHFQVSFYVFMLPFFSCGLG